MGMTEKFKVKSSKLKVLKTYAFYASALLLFCSIFILSACSPQKEKVYRKSKILMDTIITVNVVSHSAEDANRAIEQAFSEIKKLDKFLNFFSDKSELSEINRNAGKKPVRVSRDTFEVIEKAIHSSEKTNRAFDITIGPLISLWDFHNKVKPEEKTIRQKIRLVNYKDIILDKNASSVYLNKKGMRIDLGGIAKGYAADKAVAAMKRNGIKSGLVSIAGDIKAFGLKPDGKPWKIGIRNSRPANEDDDIMATIELTDMAISTAGDYERYFIIDNKRYHHILDPKTGYPADKCRSVSIIAKDGFITDSFSTGIFILGAEKGIKLLEDMGIDGIIVDKDGKIHTTKNLRGKIEFTKDQQGRKRNN